MAALSKNCNTPPRAGVTFWWGALGKKSGTSHVGTKEDSKRRGETKGGSIDQEKSGGKKKRRIYRRIALTKKHLRNRRVEASGNKMSQGKGKKASHSHSSKHKGGNTAEGLVNGSITVDQEQ